MNKTSNKKSCNMKVRMIKKGFTLVELLVVIAIISILTVITVSQFQTARKKANDVQRKADLSGLSKALQMYYTDYGTFPQASGGQVQIPDGSGGYTTIPWDGEFVDRGYVYMKKMPKENKTGWSGYCYETSADRKKFGLYANLENTEDKDCDATGYECNGVNYCFSIVSPNANKGDPEL